MAKETYSYQKRPIHMAKETYSYQRRPAHMAKETCPYGKRDLLIWQKRPIHMGKETCPSDQCIHIHVHTGIHTHSLSPSLSLPQSLSLSLSSLSPSLSLSLSSHTHTGAMKLSQSLAKMSPRQDRGGVSGMHKCQKRPIHMAKETYSYGKRDLFIWKKRPIHIKRQCETRHIRGTQSIASGKRTAVFFPCLFS